VSTISVNPWVKIRFIVNDSFLFFGERNVFIAKQAGVKRDARNVDKEGKLEIKVVRGRRRIADGKTFSDKMILLVGYGK